MVPCPWQRSRQLARLMDTLEGEDAEWVAVLPLASGECLGVRDSAVSAIRDDAHACAVSRELYLWQPGGAPSVVQGAAVVRVAMSPADYAQAAKRGDTAARVRATTGRVWSVGPASCATRAGPRCEPAYLECMAEAAKAALSPRPGDCLRVLHIGLGAGSLPSCLAAWASGRGVALRQLVAESDAGIAAVAAAALGWAGRATSASPEAAGDALALGKSDPAPSADEAAPEPASSPAGASRSAAAPEAIGAGEQSQRPRTGGGSSLLAHVVAPGEAVLSWLCREGPAAGLGRLDAVLVDVAGSGADAASGLAAPTASFGAGWRAGPGAGSAALRGAVRVLRPGGVLVVNVLGAAGKPSSAAVEGVLRAVREALALEGEGGAGPADASAAACLAEGCDNVLVRARRRHGGRCAPAGAAASARRAAGGWVPVSGSLGEWRSACEEAGGGGDEPA